MKHYVNIMFHAGNAASEYQRIGRFVNEFLILATFFQIRGVEFSILQIVLGYISLFILLAFLGKILKKIGLIDYARMVDTQANPMLVDMHNRIIAIEKEVKKYDYSRNGNVLQCDRKQIGLEEEQKKV